MSERLVTVDDPQQIQSGIVRSLHKMQVPLWIDGENVVFEDGTVRKSPGYAASFVKPGTDPVSGIAAVNVAGTANLVWGDIGNLYRFDGSTVTIDGTGFTGTVNHDSVQDNAVQDDAWQETISHFPGIWDFEPFGKWALATNGVQAPQINKMAGAGFVPLGGSPPDTVNIFVQFADQILAFDITGTSAIDGTVFDQSFFAFSDIDGPENWTTGAAGYLPIRDMGSQIFAACRLGAYVAVYSSDAMALIASLGSPLYFGAQKIFEGIGATGKHAVVPVGFYNYGISKKGVWKTDGTQYSYISPPFLRKWLEKNVNFSGFGDQIAGMLDEDRSIVEWGVPTFAGNGKNDVTVCFNIDTQAWTFKSYGITCGAKKGIFDFPAFGLSDGSVMFGNQGVDANGVAVDAWVQSKPFPCLAPSASPFSPNSPLEWKILEEAVLALRDVTGVVNVYFGWQDDLDNPITWSQAYPLDMQSQPIFPLEEIEGKYFSIKLKSTAIGADWTFAGLELFGSFNGAEF